MNDVLDALEQNFTDLNEPHEQLSKGDLVTVEAHLTLTSASEVGSLLGKMMLFMPEVPRCITRKRLPPSNPT